MFQGVGSKGEVIVEGWGADIIKKFKMVQSHKKLVRIRFATLREVQKPAYLGEKHMKTSLFP